MLWDGQGTELLLSGGLFFFLCNSHGTYSSVKIALPPVLSTTESKDRDNLSQAGTNTR